MSDLPSSPRPLGETYTFVSSKGGTGKTIITASFAYALRVAGHRVVLVDTDFATRGLSLFLLATALESEDVELAVENCLADAIVEGLPPERVEPLTIVRDGTSYDVVFANRDVYEGGAPEERVLGFGEQAVEGRRYREFVSGLLRHLRQRYDYVILDTRGGIDITSIVPATESDGYIVILEADQLSLDQVHGLLSKMSQYNNGSGRGALRGFIVNKAVFSPEDRVIERTLRRLYRGGRTFGIIPSDDDTIRSYQKEAIPIHVVPGAAFSYHALLAFDKVLSPQDRWDEDSVERFEALVERSRILYAAERRANSLVSRLPYIHFIVIVVGMGYYVAYRAGSVSTSTGAYVSLAIALAFSLATAGVGVLRSLRRRAASVPFQYGARLVLLVTVLVAIYLLGLDVPRMFSRAPLLERTNAQAQQIEALHREVSTTKGALAAANDELAIKNKYLDFSQRERAGALSQLSDARRLVITLTAESDDRQQRLDAAARELTKVTRDRDSLIKQLETKCQPPPQQGATTTGGGT